MDELNGVGLLLENETKPSYKQCTHCDNTFNISLNGTKITVSNKAKYYCQDCLDLRNNELFTDL